MHQPNDDKKRKTKFVIICSYPHLFPRSIRSYISKSTTGAMAINKDTMILTKTSWSQTMEIYHIEKYRNELKLCTSQGLATSTTGKDLELKYSTEQVVYFKHYHNVKNTFIIADALGEIRLSSNNSRSITSRSGHFAYKLDSRDLFLDDNLFYFVDGVHDLAVINVDNWHAKKVMSEVLASNIISHNAQIALFAICNNLLYVVDINCQILLFFKDPVQKQNLRHYWKKNADLNAYQLNHTDLISPPNVIPTSICATKDFLAVVFYHRAKRLSYLTVATKSLNSCHTIKLRLHHSDDHICYHATFVKSFKNNLLLLPFQNGSISILLMTRFKIKRLFNTGAPSLQKINGILSLGDGLVTIYGKKGPVTIQFK